MGGGSSGYRLGIPLNTPQCTGGLPSKKNDPAQMSVLPRWRNPAPSQSSSHVLRHLQRPLSGYRGSPITSPTPLSKNLPPQVSPNKSVWRDRGENKRGAILETLNNDVLAIHRQLPRGRNPRRGQSLVKQENVRLNSRGNPSTPPAWRPKSGWFLFAQKSMLINRHRTLLPGRPGGKRGRTGRGRLR